MKLQCAESVLEKQRSFVKMVIIFAATTQEVNTFELFLFFTSNSRTEEYKI
jgi:hypothetical protein